MRFTSSFVEWLNNLVKLGRKKGKGLSLPKVKNAIGGLIERL
jgi:hypothetical protein